MIFKFALSDSSTSVNYLIASAITLVLWIIVCAVKSKNKEFKNTNSSVDISSSRKSQSVSNATNKSSDIGQISLKQTNFILMQTEAIALYNFLKSATCSTKVRNEVDRMMGVTNNDGTPWPISQKISLTMLMDAYRCYIGLGYEIDAEQNEELGLLIFANQISNPGYQIDYNSIPVYRSQVAPKIRGLLDTVITMNKQCSLPEGQFFFQHIFENVDTERLSQYMVMLYRFASAIAKADDTITEKESKWLYSLMKSKYLSTDGKPLNISSTKTNIHQEASHKNILDPLARDAAIKIVESGTGSTSLIQRRLSIGYNRAGRLMDQLEMLGVVGPLQGSKPRELLCHSIEELEQLFNNWDSKLNSNNADNPDGILEDNAQKELQGLIGLDSVKEEVEKLTNFIKIMNIRREQGLPVSDISYHCVFTGNPGTGKTTVARIIANIYRELGVVNKGHVVETDRSGLVAEYVGQTAVKTNKIIDSALDGVLFIDEAYSLVTDNKNDYGLEAISTLLKRMEDDRNRLVVILAGYGNEMQKFIESNSGLKSRFNRYIHFPDYEAKELLAIYKCNLEKHKYAIDPEAELLLSEILNTAVLNKDKNFGNARFARNLFEKTLENQAMRLASIGSLTKEMLCTITVEDIKSLKSI